MIVADDRSARQASRGDPRGWLEQPLERLLQPLATSTFLAQAWEREPCVIAGRAADYYADILTTADIDAILSMCDPNTPDPFVSLLRYGEAGQESRAIPRAPQGTVDLRFIYQAYAEGYSIKASGLQRRWQPISQFCAALQDMLRHPVGAYLFLTPPAGQAVLPHHDAHDTIILQIEGAKHWKIYNPVVALPLQYLEQPVSDSQLGQPIQEVDLVAGDLLYIPRGYVHEAITSDVASLHLTLAVLVIRWAHLLENALARVAERDVRLREAIPADFLESPETLEAMKQQFHELLALALGEARFEDAIRPLGQHYSSAQTMPLDGHFVSLNRLRDVDLDTVVRRRTGLICTVSEADGNAVLWFSGNPIHAPLAIAPALRFIARTERFAVRELPDCLSDKGKGVLVRRLVKEGLLAVDGAPSTLRRADPIR